MARVPIIASTSQIMRFIRFFLLVTMFDNYFNKNLKEGEEVQEIIRAFPLAYFFPVSISLILILAPFFFLVPLFSLKVWGVIIFSVILLFGLILALRTFIVYSLNAFVLTNKRIIDFDQKGFFERVVSECSYNKVQDVSFEVKGILATFINFGTIRIQTAASNQNLEMAKVLKPQRAQEKITDFQKKYGGEKSEEVTAQELIDLAMKLKKNSQKIKDQPKSEA